MKPRFPSHCFLAALGILGGPPSEAGTPLWRSTPLITTASPISDQPGARIIGFSGCYLRPGGEIVFWGKLAGREEKLAWALFSYQAGTLRTVLEEGEEVTSRYSTNPAQKYHVHRGGSWHASLPLREGKFLIFSCGKGMSGSESGVFIWDGEKIRPILVPGQEVTVDGQTEKVDWASLGQPQPARETRIFIKTASPSKRVVIGLLDGDSYHSLDMKPGELPALARIPANHVALVSKGQRGAALVYKDLTETKTLLETGSIFPFDPPRTANAILPNIELSPTQNFITVETSDNKAWPVFADGAKLFSLVPPELCAKPGWTMKIPQIDLLDPGKSILLFKANVGFDGEPSGFFGIRKRHLGTHFYLWDGTASRRLTWIPHYDGTSRSRFWFLKGGRTGAILHVLHRPMAPGDAEKAKGYTITIEPNASFNLSVPTEYLTGGKVPDEWPQWFLDPDRMEEGLVPSPELSLEGGRILKLDQMVAWESATSGLAVLPDGIHRLTLSSSGTP